MEFKFAKLVVFEPFKIGYTYYINIFHTVYISYAGKFLRCQ